MPTDPYFLRSARLGFRWWTAEDRPLAALLWGDPEVTRFVGGCDPAKVDERLERHLNFARDGGVQYWPMFLLDVGADGCAPADVAAAGDRADIRPPLPGEFVGCCGLRPPEDGVYEIGLHLRPQFWHGGYGVEASQAVMGHAFDMLAAQALLAEVHPAHAASQRLLAKLGFRLSGEKLHERSGIIHEVYRLDAADYARLSQPC